MGLELWKNVCVTFTLILLSTLVKGSLVQDVDQRPRVVVDNGDMLLVAARGKDIRFQILDGGHVYLNNEDLLQLVQTVRQAVDLLGDSEGGRLSNLQRTITKLNNAIFGKSGLGTRVSQLEQGQGNSSSIGEVSGGVDAKIKNLNTKVAGLRRMILALRNKLKANECSSNPCRNGGTCEDSYDSFICRCPPNWEGTLCDTDVNECARFAGTDLGCQNGATCINKPGTYECSCATGWFGIHCTQTSNACTSSASRDLCGHGLCVSQPNSHLGFSCICEQGWTKDLVTQACTQDVDECASNHPSCSRDPPVACINVPGSFYCGGCPQGYTGNGYYCADIDECQVNNGGCSMNPTVQCINTQGSRKCGICPPGYQGDGITCTYHGVCQINNGGCHHLARCVENQAIGPSFVQCICPAGYAGSGVGESGCVAGTAVLPSHSACSSNPCIHGTCTPSGSSYICSCIIGYTGPTCAIAVNPCANNPCKNGGTCVPHQGTFHCRCPSNSTGATCEEPQMSCGGRLHSEEGSLSFPPSSTSQTYVPNLSCAWVIVTNASKVLNVTFTSFHLEVAPDCNYDWLQIHDGRSSGDRLIDRYCGTELPNNGSIISTHNTLYLWFRSDHSINKDGFSITWKSIDPVCGGNVEVSHGSISSPGYPGKYPKNRDCLWRLTAPLTRRIQFNFITVKLENHPNCSYDFLEIKDGGTSHSPVLEKLCTTSTPAPVMSSGPVVEIRFHSDDQGNDGGFLISYNTVPGIAGCGGILSGTSGTISCPMENGAYRHNLDCEWIIQVPASSRIRITFDTFELESSRDCRFDRLEVREGKEPSSPLVGRYCGNVPPRPYLSKSNYLTIIFQSDWSGSGNGFQIYYEEICGGIYGDPSGVITSPNYPENYPTNKQCVYEIAQPLGKAITLKFYDFQMESHYRCSYDYLEIRDGHDSTSPLMGTYCDHIPPTVVSTYNFLWLKFQTDFSRQRRGFYANYTTQDVSCGGILKNQTGTVESPHYPNLYRHNELCRWIIVADVGQVIQLTWTNFELERSYNCVFDSLEIYDNDTTANGSTLIGRYCGSQKPPDITSMNNILTLVFATDSSRRSSGFQVTFTQVDSSQICGGNYFSAVGTLRSPNYPNQYPHSKDCVWILKVPYGQQLKLNITDFHLEYHDNCRWDYLEIRNGGSATAPLIGKYCGTDIPPDIQAISNQLYLRFKSDYSRSAKGFEISWDGTSRGCGGTLTSPQGSIKSPNYPEPYEGQSECFWKISTSRGSTIQAVFVDVQLESSQNCVYDYVAIYDGMDASAKLLGRFCQMSNAIAVQSTSNHMFIKFRSDINNEGIGFHINYATMCTTDVIGFQGVIESPNFPSMYPSHLDCKWNIKVPKGNKVNMTFSHFELEREPCRFDYLQVSEAYHGEAIYQPLTEKLCGSRLPPPVHSTSDKVQVSMVTDYSVGHSGFRLEWLLDGCGGRLTHPEGEFTSPGYPGSYKDEVECHWYITVPLHLSVELTIHDLVMEGRMDCRFDSLTIYGGPDTSMVLVPPLCHSLTEPLVVTSSGNNMVVIFTSDVSYSGRGFRASYVGVPSRCGGLFTAPAGRIQSRNYPNNYDPHDDCLWLIKVAANHVVQLTFIDFDLEMHANCSFDYVKLFDGNTTESPVIATLCGSRMPNITTYRSTSNTLLVRMKADGSRSLKGFAANYTTACGANIITEDYGIIDLHPSVNVNEENLNCSWVIIAAQPDERIIFTITHMDLSPSMENSHESCEFAFVEVRDGNDKDAPLKGRYCGSRAPPQISSVGSALFVHMVSMYGAHYGHFSASYAVYSAGCGADLTSEHGSFASPDYPSTYPLNSECVWKITSAPGNRVKVNFRSFALEESASCNKDYLEIREGDGAGRVIGTYCTELPSNITASQTLWIKFHSDGDETAAGFIADYSLVHGNDLNGPSGEIASPLYPRSYIQEGDFSWRVTVQFGYAISITFTDFFIEKYMDFCDLYLAIYEGYDESGVEIFRGCGYLLPDPVTSSSNVVYIMMHTMAMYHGSYFKLNWLQVERVEAPRTLYPNRPPVPGCGGRIYLSDWDNGSANNSYLLQSPGYPNGYARMLNCEWIIETPSTSHAQMIVRDMDLESYEYCFSDYVTVYEGVGNTENWRQLKTMCLSNASNEGPIDASSLMKVVFHSDYSYNKTGFSSRIYSVCGGTINAPSGVIEVHNMTNQFSDRGRYMVQCQWNVTVRSGRTISVTFDRFQVPADFSGTCSNSYLMLRNGHSQDSPILGNGKYCSNTIPEIPHTTSNYLFISYYGFSNSEGFKMRFSEVAVTCGGQYTLTARNNRMSISSPNYPNIPIPHTECTWVIMAPGGERIQVDFNDTFNFNIPPGGECTLEYVELRDGGTEISPVIGRYCYSAPSTQTTTGNVLFLRFFTDTDDPHTGFHASISLARCGGTVRGYDGEISSPGYPGEYPSNIECIWRIVGYRNHLLELQFKDLHLPTSPLGCSNVDNVKITEVLPYNRTENVVQTICGTGPQPNIQLGSNEALITFKTGPKSPFPFTNRGFYMNYSSSYDICGGELSTPEGQIQSPGYPNGLPHHRYCEWDITVPRGRRITVNILDLDMDFRAGSNLMFFNRDFSYFITSLKSNSSVRQIESSGNKMRIYYYARSSTGRRGFQATYHSNQPEVCGGDILQDSGTISLSASRDNIRSLYCEWRRTNTNPGNQTFAIIISNAIVGYNINMPCSYRGTKLYAYVDENSLLLTEICRNITQGPVIILSPFLSTTFVGSQGVRGGPLNFTAQYQVLPCGGVLAGPEQIISSPGFPSNYAPNMHCAWSVSFPSGQAISVHFLAMNLETNCGHDYVKIHSGASPTAPRIGSYCGTTIPQDFVAQSNTLWIEFHSDKEVQSQGFKLHLTPVTAGCGGIMHTNTGMASSPNFPNKYPNNAECEWDIRVENGYFIQLQFVERFKLEDSSGCANDFVEVFDYREGNYVSHGKFCGANTPPFFNSTSTRMKVLFRSNGDIAADGFKMQWNVHCGGLIENVTSGTITSPGFPHAYENGLYCNYTVVVPQKPIKASFDFFHIEDAYQGCRYDNVTLYILESYSHSFYKIGEYCGINAPPEFSAMGAFSLVFETDSWGRFDGFVLRFEVVTCGGDLHDPGRIELPKLYTPYFYSSINCTWTITAPANLVVLARPTLLYGSESWVDSGYLIHKLEVTEMNVVRMIAGSNRFTELVADRYRSCYSDNSVNVYDGPYAIEDKRLGRFCGNISHSPPVLHSSGNTMVIQYLTFTYIRFQHFEADILFTYGESVGCGGRINATSSAQTIRSPDVDRDNQYEANLDCHWLIRAQDGQVLNVRMTSFQLEPCNNTSNNSSNYCGCDFLEVYDGPSQYSALIDRYCGSEIPSAIISSTNHLWLRFVSDGERNGRGFVAEVTSVNSICGPAHLNVTATLKELTSPNYPANAPVNLRCRWLLEDDSNYYFGRIAVHVEDVDIQGGGLECTNAKLEIADASVADIISEGLGENFVYSGRSTHAHSIRYGSMWPVSSVTFCGHVVPHNFYSDVGKVYVSLVTSSVPSKGFKLQYSLGGCNRNYTSVQGRIKLTQLPDSCDILIETSPNRTISLFFSENSLGNCENSGIEVKDGASSESPLLQRLCGYSTFNPIFSTGPNLRIHIWNTVHNSYNYYNLDMTYTTTDQGRGCGGELFNYGGIFTSPFYPSNNRNSSVCRWHVTVPANLRAALYFSVFDLGSSTTCSSDFVEILEVDLTTNTETVRSRYCGGDNPATYISPSNVFVLRYTVSVHNEGSGWVAHFMGKPPGSQLYEEMTALDSNSDYY